MSAYYTMNPADLPALLTAWQSGSRVLCPCKEQDGTTRLESFVPEKGLCLDYTNLAMPPVDVLNGYQDVLFRWEGNERTYVVLSGLNENMPESEAAFKLAKDGLTNRLRTERIIKGDIIWSSAGRCMRQCLLC